jgi:hypothetical protein
MKIIVNGMERELDIVDPVTGISWTEDFLGNNGADMCFDDDGMCYMEPEEFVWWENLIEQYQEADNRYHALLDDLQEEKASELIELVGDINVDLVDYPLTLEVICTAYELGI